MGHLTEIANSLQTVAARRPPVAQLLCSNTAWTDFAFGPLSERNQVRPLPNAHSASPVMGWSAYLCFSNLCSKFTFLLQPPL